MKSTTQIKTEEISPPRERSLSLSRVPKLVLGFDGVSKSYYRNAGRSILRHRLIAMWKGSPPETFCALDNVSFEVHQSESLAVIGSNGAGKSTLLRLATGISMPDAGASRSTAPSRR